jgi:hypothetical protein
MDNCEGESGTPFAFALTHDGMRGIKSQKDKSGNAKDEWIGDR